MTTADNIYDFIYRMRGKYRFALDLTLELEKDLKITGDDAEDFMNAYSNLFNVDIKNLNLHLYFANESSYEFYKLILFGIKSKKIPITIGDLLRGTHMGKLDDFNLSTCEIEP